MRKPYRHLTHTDRIKLETLHTKGYSIRDIANSLKVHISTVYRELKRGEWYHTNTDLTKNIAYSSDLAHKRHVYAVSCRGVALKIAKDSSFASYLEYAIKEMMMSPAAALGYIKENNMQFQTSISVPTLYSYIANDVFYGISNKDLPVVGKRKRDYNKVKVSSKKHKRIFGESIEARDPAILDREEFGHWEMDTVKGLITQRSCLLVLTERKTRMEIVRKMKSCTTLCVLTELEELRVEWGSLFSKVFKTITVDNGSEFADYEGMMLPKSIIDGIKMNVYYCHPYSSYERGSNENANKLIRRHIPKHTNFDDKSDRDIQKIEDWINFYPRKLFGYKNSNRMFLEELGRLLE